MEVRTVKQRGTPLWRMYGNFIYGGANSI